MNLIVTKNLLAYIKGLTVKLQNRSLDINTSFQDINVTIDTLKNVREDVTGFNNICIETATQIAIEYGIEASHPRQCLKQRHRNNAPAESVEEYYRRNLQIPFIDQLVSDLKARFDNGQATTVEGLFVIPANCKSSTDWKDHYTKFYQEYRELMPQDSSIEAEMRMWEVKCQANSACESTIVGTLKMCDKEMFPTIHKSLLILATIPISSCECERSVSALRRLKTYMRSNMVEQRLNGLALMTVHYNRPVDIDVVIRDFCHKYPRKMVLNDIMSD